MHEVVVYSRKGCHLCEVVKETLAQVEGDAEFQWREVDIDADPQLLQKFNDEVKDRNDIVAKYNELAKQVEKLQSPPKPK